MAKDSHTDPDNGCTHGAAGPRILALMNQKGGVGKTTTTVNLAAAVAELGLRTLVVDLDPQGHATLHLGVDGAARDRTIYDALHDPMTSRQSLVQARENLWLLPAEVDLAAAETELAPAVDRHQRLRDCLTALDLELDVVLIDCPPSLGLLTLNALRCATDVLVPMQAQFLALQGVGKLLETVSMVSRSMNPGLRVAGITLCMHDENTRLAREVVADLEGFFTEARNKNLPWSDAVVFAPPIRRHIKLAECASFGQTIFEYAPGMAGADDYASLALAIAERILADAPAMQSRTAQESVPEQTSTPEAPIAPLTESAREPLAVPDQTPADAEPDHEQSQASASVEPKVTLRLVDAPAAVE
jgi:chromosome partitioning protein